MDDRFALTFTGHGSQEDIHQRVETYLTQKSYSQKCADEERTLEAKLERGARR